MSSVWNPLPGNSIVIKEIFSLLLTLGNISSSFRKKVKFPFIKFFGIRNSPKLLLTVLDMKTVSLLSSLSNS